LIGGAFSTYNGIPRNGIARLNTDGSLDTSFDPGTGARTACITLQPDNKILIGGSFTSYDGIGHNRVARIMNDLTTNVPTTTDDHEVVYPNPTNGRFMISSGFDGPMVVTVSDLLGKVVWSERMIVANGRTGLMELKTVSPGTYLVTMQSGETKSTARLIMQ